MNNRLAIPALAAVMAAFSVTATAQVTLPKTAKTLPSVTGWSHTSDTVTDVWTDAAGNRYVVGQSVTGSTVDGFLVKTNKRGVMAAGFPVTIDLGASESPTAVAVDASGNIFVADEVGSLPNLIKYDANGNLLGSGNAFYNGVINDLTIDANGNPISCGTSVVSGVNNASIYHWLADASDWDNGFHFSALTFTSMAYRGDGYLTLSGTRVLSATNNCGSIAVIDPTFGNGIRYAIDWTTSNDIYTEIAVEPISNLAVAVGTTTEVTGGAKRPIIGSIYTTWNGTAWAAATGGGVQYNYDSVGQATGVSVATTGAGDVFFGFDGGVATGPAYVDVYHATNVGGAATVDWADEVADAANQTLVDLVSAPGNTVAGLIRDETVIGSGPSAFSAYNLYGWTGSDRGDRKVLGTKFQKIPATAPTAYPNSLMSYSGGKFLLAFAPIEGNTAGVFPGEFKVGPNDTYKTDEDTTLTIGVAKSLLANDPNFFVLDPLTAAYHAGSASAGLSSVTVNANGSFTAVPAANFNGVATFTYDVYQNAAVIATYTATINIKAKNDAPVANNDTFNVAANSAPQNLDVLANDTDIDGDILAVLSKTNTANGTVGITPDKKFITFKPKAGFTGVATFTYTCKDPKGLQSTATVTVNVS